MAADRWLQLLLNGPQETSALASALREKQAERDAERRSQLVSLGAPPQAKAPAALVYHRHSGLSPTFWPEMSPEELRGFDRALAFKEYSGAPRVALPRDRSRQLSPLREAIASRRTVAGFGSRTLTLVELAELMGLAFGVTGETDGLPRRAYPSAGSCYPIEIYLVPFQVEDLEPSLYHYRVPEHSLELLRSFEEISAGLEASLPAGLRRAQPAALLVLTIGFERAFAKYQERGYRFALLEAGHMVQNILLVGTAMGLGTTSVGGFFDDPMNRMLGLDEESECAVYGALVGAKA
ncbi:MAG: SagB/ThcOx family dehydrogenase [Deltaproteobacteria bacterium]|nr:SagB/ThcOx family dehydrogenase [Deltaproteobacteria bacterium]